MIFTLYLLAVLSDHPCQKYQLLEWQLQTKKMTNLGQHKNS